MNAKEDTPAAEGKGKAVGRCKWWRRLLGRCIIYYIAAMISLVSVALMFFAEPLCLTVEEVPVGLRCWAPECAEARVVMLADLHAAQHDGPRLERIVQCTAEQKPEAVVLLGDYFSALKPGKAMKPEQVAAYLAPLAQLCPVYYVCGNHDMGKNGSRLRKAFKEKGFINLENAEQVHTFANGQKLMLRGVTHSAEPAKTGGDLSKHYQARRFAAAKLPADMPLLAVAHNPYYFLHAPIWADLAVGGHTHGGQVCMPGGRPLTMHAPWSPQAARAGMKRGDSGNYVYISRGLGLSRLPIRFCCPPEITVLELKAQ